VAGPREPDRQGRAAARRHRAIALALLTPAALLLAFAFLAPLARVLALSAGLPGAAGLDRYQALIGDDLFRSVLRTSLLLALGTTLLALAIGYPVAAYLVRSRSWFRRPLYVLVIAPMLVSVVVRTFGWVVLLGQQGVLNQALAQLHLAGRPVPLLYNPVAVAVALAQTFLPFMVLSLTSSLASVDRTAEEAARTLGASRLRTFLHITLPLSAPGVGAGCALVFSLALGSYITPQVVGGGRVLTVTTLIYQRIENSIDWATGSAMAVLLLAMVFLVMAVHFFTLARTQRWRRRHA
jgi:putative spermidine/putrescine transport system permease protein